MDAVRCDYCDCVYNLPTGLSYADTFSPPADDKNCWEEKMLGLKNKSSLKVKGYLWFHCFQFQVSKYARVSVWRLQSFIL